MSWARYLAERPAWRWFAALCLAAHILAGPAAADPPGERDRVKRMIAEQALDLKVPVSLALAVAHAESEFDPRAESRKGARGVMQIMPATAKGEYGIHPDSLWLARLNVRLGLHFLKRLLRRYQGRADLALSYYNGGSAVGVLPSATVIPATARYVEKVQKLRQRYLNGLLQGTMQ